MNEREREQLQAETLDVYLTNMQSGRPADRPRALPADQATFLHALVDLGKANPPDAGFAGQLEARLRTAARQRNAARRGAHPRPRNALWGTERMMSMNRRLVYLMSGAALLALILFGVLALLSQNKPAVGPDQAAQLPTFTPTSIPTAIPTYTSLPPTAVVRETPLPVATPTREIAAPTTIPTATLPPTPGEPISLPALAKWQEAGYGGGGMGDPIATTKTFVLGVELPLGPEQMIVYLQREPEKLTAAYAAQMAGRLSVQGEVYQSIRLTSVPNPEDEPFRGYLAVDGARQVMFEATGIARYTDRNRTPYVEGSWREPGAMPPLAEAIKTAEAFLRSAGLLEGDVQMSASGDMLSFYRVLDGQWPLVEPFVRVYIWSDGQIGQVVYTPQALDVLAEYPIILAQEAWEILISGQRDERVWQNPYRSPELPPWGEWRHQNATFWARSHETGQQAHRFGVLHTWFPVEAGGTPYVTIGDLVLTGDVQALAEYALQQYAREQWAYVHVWGEVRDAGDYQTLAVEGWEPAEETYWIGMLRRQSGQDTLVMDDGCTVQLPDLPADLADGTQVSVSGGQAGDGLEWHMIQEMSVAEPPSQTRVANLQMTVEQVDLVYLSLAPNVIPPDRFADLGYRAVQPAWRFRGQNDRGEAFEVYVQAVQSAYVEE